MTRKHKNKKIATTFRTEPSITLPRSVTAMPINVMGLVVTVFAFFMIRKINPALSTLYAVIICLSTFSISIMALEVIFLKTYSRSSTGLNFSLKRQWELSRIIIKLFGFYVTIVLIAVMYWLFPEYHGSFYNDYWNFLKTLLSLVLLGAIPYFIFVDHFMVDPKDGYWHIGMLALGQWSRIDRIILGQHFRGWLVKAFFLPLMFTYSCYNMKYFQTVRLHEATESFFKFHHFACDLIFSIDVLYATTGYIFSLRLFDSHIRSVEPTFIGWLVTLECYQPFWSFFSSAYLRYSTDFSWEDWLSRDPFIRVVWGISIVLLLLYYVYATIPFGIRFSNLTNRGILTNGPYRFCKHPAYVSKNLSWWLISIPFISHAGSSEAMRSSMLLLCVNIIYFLRARTEEKHLSKDPAYIEYATIMNNRSIFAWLGKLLPVLQFKPHQLFNFAKKD